MKIVGPESSEPMMIENIGNTALLPFGTDDAGVFLLEKTPSGNIVFYRWFKESKRLFQFNAYNLRGDLSATALYECKRIASE